MILVVVSLLQIRQSFAVPAVHAPQSTWHAVQFDPYVFYGHLLMHSIVSLGQYVQLVPVVFKGL